MQEYSPFFQTLYDQQEPVGQIGRGTHYSVLRAVIFPPLQAPKYHDFAVIWDEDHDTRVIDVIYQIYCMGKLQNFYFFGERKGFFTALPHSPDLFGDNIEVENDSWNFDSHTTIISDSQESVELYLKSIDMLWKLGSKPITSLPK